MQKSKIRSSLSEDRAVGSGVLLVKVRSGALPICALALLAALAAGCSSNTPPPTAAAANAYWAGPKKLPPALQLAEANTYANLKPQVPAGMNTPIAAPTADGRAEYEAFVSGGK